MRNLLLTIALIYTAGTARADNFNSITVQGQLNPATPIYGVGVNVLSGGQVVGTASNIDLVPDVEGFFSTQTYITNPSIFLSGLDYVVRLSSPVSGEVISTFSVTAVPFALTVRGDNQTGNQNVFGAYGNVGIGTSSPAYRLVISSGAGSNEKMLVIATGTSEMIRMTGSGEVYANRYYGDGSALTGIYAAGDNLGNHTATQALNLNSFGLTNVSTSTFSGYVNVISTIGYAQWGATLLRTDANHENIYLGYLSGNYAGVDNTFLGNYTGYSNSGYNNVFVGEFSGSDNSGGSDNAFIGTAAGFNNTSGVRNSFLGAEAGENVVNGSNNTLLGFGAGVLLVNTNNNTIIGSQASFNGGAGSNNSFMGYQAGYNNLGDSNVFLGYQAGYSNTTGSNNIVIGASQSGGGNSLLNIGGVLYGNLANRTIGIYRATQEAALDVVSTGTAANQFSQIWRDSAGVIKSSMSATGVMMAVKYIGDGSGLTGLAANGDNLGNHVATTTLNMAGFGIDNASSIVANAFYGDGSHLTGLPSGADNLGNHIATQTLNMAGNQILNVSSLTISGKDGSGYSLSLSSGINMPSGTITAGLLSGNGTAVTGLNASNIASGTVADGRLSANVNLLNENQTITGIKTFVSSVSIHVGDFSVGVATLSVSGGIVRMARAQIIAPTNNAFALTVSTHGAASNIIEISTMGIPAFYGYKSSTQLIGSPPSKINIDSFKFDTVDGFQPQSGKYVAKQKGYYMANAQVCYSGGSASRIGAYVVVNGAERLAGLSLAYSPTEYCANVAGPIYLNVGDYVELHGYVHSSSFNIFAPANYTFLSLVRLF